MLNRILVLLVTAGLLAIIGLWFYPELVKRNEMAATLEAKKAELAREKEIRREREREKRLLETDPEYVEVVARDRLDLMKEGETIFRLDGTNAAPAGPPPPVATKPPPSARPAAGTPPAR